jgi:hypothetical protein
LPAWAAALEVFDDPGGAAEAGATLWTLDVRMAEAGLVWGVGVGLGRKDVRGQAAPSDMLKGRG